MEPDPLELPSPNGLPGVMVETAGVEPASEMCSTAIIDNPFIAGPIYPASPEVVQTGPVSPRGGRGELVTR